MAKCREGAVGYFVFCDPISESHNLWEAYILFTKLSKKGRPCLKAMRLNIPIVDTHKIYSGTDLEVLDKIKVFEGLELSNETKISTEVELEIIKPDFKGLISAPIHDYLAFLCALFSLNQRFLTRSSRGYVPGGKVDGLYLEELENFIVNPELEKVQCHERSILRALNIGGELGQRFLGSFENRKDLKMEILETAWKKLVMALDWVSLYRETRFMQITSTLNHLNSLITYWKNRPELLSKLTSDPNSVQMAPVAKEYCPHSEWELQDTKCALNNKHGKSNKVKTLSSNSDMFNGVFKKNSMTGSSGSKTRKPKRQIIPDITKSIWADLPENQYVVQTEQPGVVLERIQEAQETAISLPQLIDEYDEE
jgi:hypothetical protein